MRRRDVLLGGVAAGALATAGPALAAPERGSTLAGRIDERQRRLGARVAPFGPMVPDLAGPEDGGLFADLQAAASALVAYGSVHGVSEAQVADAAVQQRLHKACVDAGRSLRSVAGRLEALSSERVAELHASLFADPGWSRRTMDAIRAEVSSMGIAPKVRDQLMRTVERVAFRMERQGTASVLDDLLERFRRAEARIGARADKRVEAARDPEIDDLPLRSPDEDKADQALGAVLLGLGLTTGGVLLVGIASTSGFLALCICVSVPMLVATILLLSASARAFAGGK
jgi:hypothetical protein